VAKGPAPERGHRTERKALLRKFSSVWSANLALVHDDSDFVGECAREYIVQINE